MVKLDADKNSQISSMDESKTKRQKEDQKEISTYLNG